MSEGPTAPGAAHRVGSGTVRLVRAWKKTAYESRLAAFASIALILTLFLPWYQVTLIAQARSARLQSASATITGWGAFSFVEAAVLVVAVCVLVLLFQRAEGRAFHLPGGDGGVISAAGVWTCVLIVWRIFDKQGATTNGPSATTSGVEWGIFIALGAAAFLAYSGSRIRAAHRPEPPLAGEAGDPAGSGAEIRASRQRRAAARPPDPPSRHRTPDATARRRARPPQPVAADPPPGWSHDSPPPARPSRRAAADELFEPVVPDDPPAMPFGRAKPAQVNLPLGEDDTHPLGADDTLPLREDETLPLDRDDTLPLGRDDTLPLDRDDRH